jgi:hypothetical protein
MMNRNDLLELIVAHANEQGIYSADYVYTLDSMSIVDLEAELDRLETIAVYGGY